jgi:hypothetical protein
LFVESVSNVDSRSRCLRTFIIAKHRGDFGISVKSELVNYKE